MCASCECLCVPNVTCVAVNSAVHSPPKKKARTNLHVVAQSSRRFDLMLEHVPEKRRSKGDCAYCHRKGVCGFQCKVCQVPLHFRSNQYAWPCADRFHRTEYKDHCYADHPGGQGWSIDPQVEEVRTKQAAATAPKPLPASNSGRKLRRVTVQEVTVQEAPGKAVGRGRSKKQ